MSEELILNYKKEYQDKGTIMIPFDEDISPITDKDFEDLFEYCEKVEKEFIEIGDAGESNNLMVGRFMTDKEKPEIVDKEGNVLRGEAQGRLCISQSWPGQMRTVYGDHNRFIETYFSQFEGKYFTGDGCRRDKDGYYWITGRVDDVIIVSGHNLGTAEIESAFVAHPKVAEAAVVGYPHDIKGNGLYCYVTLNAGEKHDGELERELKLWVRKQIGPIATPDYIQFSPGLPKTRSGKIMRRILRKIAANEHDQLGDTTTLADPSVVKSLVENRKNT